MSFVFQLFSRVEGEMRGGVGGCWGKNCLKTVLYIITYSIVFEIWDTSLQGNSFLYTVRLFFYRVSLDRFQEQLESKVLNSFFFFFYRYRTVKIQDEASLLMFLLFCIIEQATYPFIAQSRLFSLLFQSRLFIFLSQSRLFIILLHRVGYYYAFIQSTLFNP